MTSKVLLTTAVTGLAGGSLIDFHGVGANPALAAVLPSGVIAFGLFLIVFMLEKDVAEHDREQDEKLLSFHANPATTRTGDPKPLRQVIVKTKQ
jgi:hypothetical protein